MGPRCPNSGQLSKLHVNKAHFCLHVQKKKKKKKTQCLSIYIIFLVEVYFKLEKILVSVHS